MAERDEQAQREAEALRELATTLPNFCGISDNPLAPGEYEQDTFGLAYRVGPIFDIIRHERTGTPLCVAIYGPWGSGKTSAMAWLQGMLRAWNEEVGRHRQAPPRKGKRKGKGEADDPERWSRAVAVYPVLFYPWKYQNREDVWRGLIAEIILQALPQVKDMKRRYRQALTAAREFGGFLGQSFLTTLKSIRPKLKAGDDPGGAVELEADLEKLIDGVSANWEKYRRPAQAYLNEFEDRFGQWVKNLVTGTERLAIFIDDLDRCMPQVALQVLEALKLYLSVGRVVFVVGVHRAMIDDLVAKHHVDIGIKDRSVAKYLDKMFQLEVTLDATDDQVRRFLARQLAAVSFGQDALDDEQQEIFERIILRRAQRIPREIKRLVNSAMMYGAGVLIGERADTTEARPRITFAQGVQWFFVTKVLGERSMSTLAGSDDLAAFLHRWSEIVRETPGNAARYVPGVEEFLPSARPEAIAEARARRAPGDPRRAPGDTIEEGDPRSPKPLPEPYARFQPLFGEERFRRLLPLLSSRDLGDLMQIEFPAPEAQIGRVLPSTTPGDPIAEAVARSLGRNVEDLTPADYGKVTKLVLSDAPLSDISPLAGMESLTTLDLSGTQVSDISPLAGMKSLEWLDLSDTQVSDISPLTGMESLEGLDLSGTQVSDISPLAGMKDLRSLSLSGTQVSDISPLAGMKSLGYLSLFGTQVSDISPLAKMERLEHLFLSNTQVSDISPLAGMKNLRRLNLSGTQVPAEDVERLRQALPDCQIVY